MKFSEHWLRTLVDPALSSAELQETLTMAGLEVELAEAVAPPFESVVAARIESVAPHPNAERLRVCTVDARTGRPLTIVCGAPNAAAGTIAPCALVGARLPGGVEIGRATMRGVESEGMLCSARELGIGDDAGGLLVLDSSTEVGLDVRTALALDDTLITLKLTPNRADCLSLLGIAREVAALTATPLADVRTAPVPVTSSAVRRVRVEDPRACPRFASRIIENVDPRAPTPAWMKTRLERSGIRSISAIVDITNYVMLELGQPLHAYDDRLLHGDMVVRFARAGEHLTLLNEQPLELDADLLLVADEARPLGLAGIMGGADSGIGDATRTVFLEGAFWNPAVIQGKSRRLGFSSDAGHRFERGVDPELGPRGVERATALILEICGGSAGPLQDVRFELPQRLPVRVRAERIRRLLGVAVPSDVAAAYFVRLGCSVERDGDTVIATPPTYRFDLAIEEDFVEEVARLHGYEAIPAAPARHLQRMLPAPEAERSARTLRERLAMRDWQEVITFSFVSSAWEEVLFRTAPEHPQPIKVLNPIAAQLDVMRTTLLGGLIEVLRTNLARRAERVRIFELGRCFERVGGSDRQPLRLGGLAYGSAVPEQWGARPSAVDFYDVKGDLEAILHPDAVSTSAAVHPSLHPGRSAVVSVAGAAAGWIGQLHPALARHFELPRAPIVFELALEALCTTPIPVARPVSKLPRVRRDMAIVVDDAVPAAGVVAALRAAAPGHVELVQLFDVYRGTGIPEGMKSLAILVVMQDTERTLTDAEIDDTMAALLRVITERFHGSLRQ